MVSLGIHIDLHTPTLDLHLPLFTVQLGRNDWQGRRFVYHDDPTPAWNGHTDNCDHPRFAECPSCGGGGGHKDDCPQGPP